MRSYNGVGHDIDKIELKWGRYTRRSLLYAILTIIYLLATLSAQMVCLVSIINSSMKDIQV